MLLLQQRLRVNTAWGDHNDTALHLAVSHNYRDVVEALVAKGADVNACDSDGDTPLQWLSKVVIQKWSRSYFVMGLKSTSEVKILTKWSYIGL